MKKVCFFCHLGKKVFVFGSSRKTIFLTMARIQRGSVVEKGGRG